VDRIRIGKVFRAIRRDRRLRQGDIAALSGVAQQTISDIERGQFGRLSIDVYCRVAEAIGADVNLAPTWRGPKLARLLDKRHAALQNAVASELSELGWVLRIEEPFNHFGDRGSVDILGTWPVNGALLIVEIKSEIDSLEETVRTLRMKSRVVPIVQRRDSGRASGPVGAVLVLPEGSTHRDLLMRHGALISASLPARNWDVRRWLAEPAGDLRGVLFFRDTDPGGTKLDLATPDRIRRPGPIPPNRGGRPAKPR
jgi:transcriptional regulator with XRE-family HTH domain